MATQNSIFEDVEELKLNDVTQQDEIDNNKIDIMQNETSIIVNSNAIDQNAAAIAAGGVIINRKIGLAGDIPFTPVQSKVSIPVTIDESKDLLIISFDGNNDHILKRDGEYLAKGGITVRNEVNQSRTVNLFAYTIDQVTLQKTEVFAVPINLTGLETVNLPAEVNIDRLTNDLLFIVEMQGPADVTLVNTSTLRMSTNFTVSGTGVVTKDTNIGPNDPDYYEIFDTPVTQEDLNKAFDDRLKELKQAIEGIGNNLNMSNGGRITNAADPVDNQDYVTKQYLIDNPTGLPNYRRVDNLVSSMIINSQDELNPNIIPMDEDMVNGDLYAFQFRNTIDSARSNQIAHFHWSNSGAVGGILVAATPTGGIITVNKIKVDDDGSGNITTGLVDVRVDGVKNGAVLFINAVYKVLN